MSNNHKTAAQQKGQAVEDQACRFLQRQGMRLLARNYHCRHGELDLVMKDNDTIVFVEVRYRKNENFGGALGSIDYNKQRRLIATAQHYLQGQRQPDAPCRFDVIAVSGQDDLQWLSNAIELR